MNRIKKALYDLARNDAKKYLTNSLGIVVEEDDRLICYVEKSRVKKKNYRYTIACLGIGKEKYRKEMAKKFQLDKPICYVIDGLELKRNNVYIFGYDDCEVIIKNCNFELNYFIHIHVNGKCTLDNTDIKPFSHLSINANELIIKNIRDNQIEILDSKSNIGFGANRIDVIDSNIGSKKKNIKVSFLATNGLNITNSNISGKEVECEAYIINIDEKSSLTAANKVSLKTNDFDPITINAPIIALNGDEMINKKGKAVLKKITNSIDLKRIELINLLRKAKEECELLNFENASQYKEGLDTYPISRILKR